MMNLEFIYLFSSRQHPATSPFQKVISIPRAAPDAVIRERATSLMIVAPDLLHIGKEKIYNLFLF